MKRLIPAWAYLFVEDRWSGRLNDIWSNSFALPHPRIRLGLSGAHRTGVAAALLDGFHLARIDQALLDLDPGNLDAVTDLMDGWRSSELS